MTRPPLPIGTWGTIRVEPGPKGYRARARFRDFDGRTRDVERNGRTKGAARSALTAALAERTAPAAEELTGDTRLEQLAALWLEEIRAAGRAESTRRRYRETLDNYVLPALGALRIREATVSRFDRFLKLTTEQTGGATAKLCRSVLSGMMGLAVRHGAAGSNPLRDVAGVAIAKPEPRALKIDEVRALREAIRQWQAGEVVGATGPKRGRPPTQDLLPLVDFMLATGARIGELLAARWADLDLEAGELIITGTVVWTDTKPAQLIRQDHPKTSSSRRQLTLPSFAVASLMEHRMNVTAANVYDLIFPSASGTPKDPSSVRKQLGKVLGPVGLDWVTPHTFRRTVATAIANGSDLNTAAAQLGHTGTAVTSRHYVQKTGIAPDSTAILDLIVSGG